jgi:hypothetical protein
MGVSPKTKTIVSMVQHPAKMISTTIVSLLGRNNHLQYRPTTDDTGSDADADGIPIEWEHRYGFNPLVWDDHETIDLIEIASATLKNTRPTVSVLTRFGKDVFLRSTTCKNPLVRYET